MVGKKKTKSSRRRVNKISRRSSSSGKSSLSEMDIKLLTKTPEYLTLVNEMEGKSIKSIIGQKNNLKVFNEICETELKARDIRLNKKIISQLCHCILQKNKNLTMRELQELSRQHREMPSSSCITKYDSFISKDSRKSRN